MTELNASVRTEKAQPDCVREGLGRGVGVGSSRECEEASGADVRALLVGGP